MTKSELIRFEKEVADRFERKEIHGPIHLSGGNEDQLIEIFKEIKPEDWVFSTWRSHFHALLHGVPEDLVMYEIMQGHSMNLMFPGYNFFTSAIVGGILPIATGVAAGLKRKSSSEKVWCFIGDMTATAGIYYESRNYARSHGLPITIITEDNGVSCNSPTQEIWGDSLGLITKHYEYQRQYPHCGSGNWVTF